MIGPPIFRQLLTIPIVSNWETEGEYDLPIRAIAWIGRAPVTISNLDRDLSMPLKSLSSDQPPGWNDAYETDHMKKLPRFEPHRGK